MILQFPHNIQWLHYYIVSKKVYIYIYIIYFVYTFTQKFTDGCRYIDEIKLIRCVYINNTALPLLSIVKDTLTTLEIRECKSVTDEGMRSLKNLKYVFQIDCIITYTIYIYILFKNYYFQYLQVKEIYNTHILDINYSILDINFFTYCLQKSEDIKASWYAIFRR